MPRGSLDREREDAYRDGLAAALRAGGAVLERGGTSLDAVAAAVVVLEDDPMFNAGAGSVFNEDGSHHMDASIMTGVDRDAGAVAGVRHLRNPVAAARLVLEKSPHVLLAGDGAEVFALAHGLAYVTQEHFFTQRRWDALLAAKNSAPPEPGGGTVGAVAVDSGRSVAAATSTGGQTNMHLSRVGDSPVPGAGTYADDNTVAVSCTGLGEAIMRAVAAYDISALIEYRALSVDDAAQEVLLRKVPSRGGEAGAIVLTPRGEFVAPHSTPGILNGYLTRSGEAVVRVYDDETPATG